MKTNDDIISEWEIDCEVNSTQLDSESIKIPKLHAKYVRYLQSYKGKYTLLSNEYDKMKLLRWEYYNGKSSEETLKKYKWEPFGLKVLKADLHNYLSADDILMKKKNNLDDCKETIQMLEDILKQLSNRNFTIKNAIDFLRYTNGS